MPTTAGMGDVGLGVRVRMLSSMLVATMFYGLVVAVIAVDDLGGDVVVEEPRDDLDADESEDEEDEEQPGRLCW